MGLITNKGLEIAKEMGLKISAANTVLSPGKFEGEHVSTLYFWDLYMNGMAGFYDEDGVIEFDLEENEREELNNSFPTYAMLISDCGHVYGNI